MAGSSTCYREFDGGLSYWRLAGGSEVDFVVGDMQLAVEVKASARIGRQHLKGIRSMAQDHPQVRRRIVVCLEPKTRLTDDGIEVVPAEQFVRRLWQGELFQLFADR